MRGGFPSVPLTILAAAWAFVLVRPDTRGGVRLVYRVSGLAAATRVAGRAERLGGSARFEHGRVVVELPDASATDDMEGATLEFKMVLDGTREMQQLAQAVASDEQAKAHGVTVGTDSWANETNGTEHHDFYLAAPTCAALRAYLVDLFAARRELQPDYGSELGFETIGRDDRPRCRSYLVDSRVELDSSHMAEAQVIWDPTTNRPEVLLTFDDEGRRRFADLSARSLGRRLAILVSGWVTSAPEFKSAVPGGRATITLGAGTAREMQAEAESLVERVRLGSIGAGVKLESTTPSPPRFTASNALLLRAGAALCTGLIAFLLARRFTRA